MAGKATKSSGKIGKIKVYAEKFGVVALVSLLVSGLVSGAISTYFATRLENAKARVNSIIHQKDQFDASQNDIFAQLGIYTDRLLKGDDPANKEQLQKAIITAQLQLNRLQTQLREEDRRAVTEYAQELENLAKQLRTVSGPSDLRPVYVSAQKMLRLHDQVADRVRSNLAITVF